MRFKTLLTCCCALFFIQNAFSTVIYVNKNAVGANNGMNWADAFTDLNDGLGAALSGDEIWLAAGVYKPTTTSFRDIHFSISEGVSLYGGFDGTEFFRNQRDWSVNFSVLSGAIGVMGDPTDNSYSLLWADGLNIVLDGLRFRRAYRDVADNTGYAGAVFVGINITSDVSIRHCQFGNNTANNASAILVNTDSNLNLENCLIFNNMNNASTIVHFSTNATGIIQHCTFANNNWVESFGANVGGSISSYLEINNSIIWDDFGHSSFGTSITITANNCLVNDPGVTGIDDVFNNLIYSDPVFTNPAANDFTLQPGSPAIEYGDNTLSTNYRDLNHGLRTWNQNVDLGCYESVANRILHVNHAAVGMNTGNSWDNAFVDLQDAIAEAVDGDQIWVATGIYKPTSIGDRSLSFELKHNVPIYGGFAGYETAFSARDFVNNIVVLSGNLGGILLQTDNSYHVVKANDPNGDFVLDGLVIQFGYADGIGLLEDGGAGILIENANSFELINSWIFFNEAISSGGGVWVMNSVVAPNFLNSSFQANVALNGGAFAFDSHVYSENCIFKGNSAQSGVLFANNGASLDLRNAILFNNTVDNLSTSHLIDGMGGSISGQVVNSISSNNTFLAGNTAAPNTALSFHHCILDGSELNPTQMGAEVFFENAHFIDPWAGDFKLCQGSAGYDNGVDSLVTSSIDILGSTRILGDHVDFGCVESEIQKVVYVKQDAVGNNDGTSWLNAYTHLEDALADPSCNKNIYLAQGVYVPTAVNDRSASFVINDGTKIYGGFIGNELLFSHRNWSANLTVLSGEIGNAASTADNSYSIVTVASRNVLIEGVTFEGAYQDPSISVAPEMSAVNVQNHTDVELIHCVFKDNTAYTKPVVAVGDSSKVVMLENLIYNNSCGSGELIGLGVSSHLTIQNCTITENSFLQNNGICLGGLPSSSISAVNNIIWTSTMATTFGATQDNVQHSILNTFATDGGDSFVNITTLNPNFVNPLLADFHINNNSPANKLGLLQDLTEYRDLDYNIRTIFPSVDVGCYDVQGCEVPHDLCQDAIPLEVNGPPLFGSNECVAVDLNEFVTPCSFGNGQSVWYSFIAPPSGDIVLNLTDIVAVSAILDIKMSLFEGSCASLSYTSCNNTATFTPISLDANGLLPGTEYFVRIEGAGTQDGTFVIQVSENTACLGDFDFDGFVNTADLLYFLAEFNCTVGCTADLDGDSIVNTADLLIFLTNFNTACP